MPISAEGNRSGARSRRAVVVVAVLLAGAFLAACGEDEVRTYTVPKGSEVIAASGTPDGPAGPRGSGTSVPAAVAFQSPGDDGRPWVLPVGWVEKTDNPPMRLATFVAEGPSGLAEIAITRFPGDVGGLLANVNRWRGQIGMAPVEASALPDLVVPFGNPGFEGYFVHLHGQGTEMLAAGIHEIATDETWFVRLVADPQTAHALRDEVFAFAMTFGAAAGMAEVDP